MKMRWKTIAIAVAAVVGTTTAILRFAPSSFAPEAQRDAVNGPRVTHRAKPQVMFPELKGRQLFKTTNTQEYREERERTACLFYDKVLLELKKTLGCRSNLSL